MPVSANLCRGMSHPIVKQMQITGDWCAFTGNGCALFEPVRYVVLRLQGITAVPDTSAAVVSQFGLVFETICL